MDRADVVTETIRWLAQQPVTLRDLSTHRYVVPSRLRRFLEARDRTRPAATTDKDHRTPWPQGPTHPDNLQCLCRHHHRAKQATFHVQLRPDGTHTWTTRRTGHTRDRPPHPW